MGYIEITVKKYDRVGHPRKEIDEKALKEMLNERKPYREIGAALGVGASTVARRKRELQALGEI